MPNCVVSGTFEENPKVLDTAHAVGLRAFVHDLSMPIGVSDEATRQRVHEIAARYKDHPAMASYFLVDDPGAEAFPALAETVEALREADPEEGSVAVRVELASGDAELHRWDRAVARTAAPQ